MHGSTKLKFIMLSFGYIWLCEIIGIVAACFVQSAMKGLSLIFRVKLTSVSHNTDNYK